MAGNVNSKLKLLRIYDILCEESDEDNPMTAADISMRLGAYGISAERKSVYSDISLLQSYGYDIIKVTSPKKGYYVGDRNFQLAEVRLLIDAVQSAKFITETKTAELIEKIENKLSISQKAKITNQVYVDHRNKNGNEKIYYTIDSLFHAVTAKKKVRIHYIKRCIEPGEKPKNEEHVYIVSPYALIWSNDKYYLVCNNAKYENLMHLRIDRIISVAILEDPVRALSEVSDYGDRFDASDYAAKVFNMFSGEPERINVTCANAMWDIVRDRFGDDVTIVERDNDTFTISTIAAVSEGLVAWLLQYADKMVVKSPASLKKSVLEKAMATVKAYE